MALHDLQIPESLAWAHPLVQEWFVRKFGTPTEPQEAGWPHILARRTTLISAPTGSGKTLTAFLACIDQLVRKALVGMLTNGKVYNTVSWAVLTLVLVPSILLVRFNGS